MQRSRSCEVNSGTVPTPKTERDAPATVEGSDPAEDPFQNFFPDSVYSAPTLTTNYDSDTDASKGQSAASFFQRNRIRFLKVATVLFLLVANSIAGCVFLFHYRDVLLAEVPYYMWFVFFVTVLLAYSVSRIVAWIIFTIIERIVHSSMFYFINNTEIHVSVILGGIIVSSVRRLILQELDPAVNANMGLGLRAIVYTFLAHLVLTVGQRIVLSKYGSKTFYGRLEAALFIEYVVEKLRSRRNKQSSQLSLKLSQQFQQQQLQKYPIQAASIATAATVTVTASGDMLPFLNVQHVGGDDDKLERAIEDDGDSSAEIGARNAYLNLPTPVNAISASPSIDVIQQIASSSRSTSTAQRQNQIDNSGVRVAIGSDDQPSKAKLKPFKEGKSIAEDSELAQAFQEAAEGEHRTKMRLFSAEKKNTAGSPQTLTSSYSTDFSDTTTETEQFTSLWSRRNMIPLKKMEELLTQPRKYTTSKGTKTAQQEAEKVVTKMWKRNKLDPTTGELTFGHFLIVFGRRSLAIKAFKLFEVSKSARISRSKMVTIVTAMINERKNVTLALRDREDISSVLRIVMNAVFIVIAPVLILLFFGYNWKNSLLPSATFLISLNWIFADMLKKIFHSISLIFIMRPFDTGDTIRINSTTQKYKVAKINLLTTKVFAPDGRCFYFHNSVLANNTVIENVTRSKGTAFLCTLDIPFNTSVRKLSVLQEGIKRYIVNNNALSKNYRLSVDRLENNLTDLKLVVRIEAPNVKWSEAGLQSRVRTEFYLFVKRLCEKLEIDSGYNAKQLITIDVQKLPKQRTEAPSGTAAAAATGTSVPPPPSCAQQ